VRCAGCQSSYSALWSASARLAVSAASFLTCSAASSLALNFGAHAVRGGMLALNACHRAQLGFAPARFAGARWEPAQQIRRTGRLPGFRQRPPHRPPVQRRLPRRVLPHAELQILLGRRLFDQRGGSL